MTTRRSPHAVWQNRLIGLETEYGCLVDEELRTHDVIARLRTWIFRENRFGLLDQHHRDWDEPPGNGGFLFNGGRVYEDMGHIEACTPECASVREVVLYDRANDILLQRGLDELGLSEGASLIRNNIDHYTGATFGCHENFLMRRQAALSEDNIHSLLAFLTLRSLYTGSGRIGGFEAHRHPRSSSDRDGLLARYQGFQMTQRADYIENDFFRWVQGNRAIINTRDEPLADPLQYRRLHLLHGDTNVLPSALFLKLGTTSLVLDLAEVGALPDLRLESPVTTLKEISYNPSPPWPAAIYENGSREAVDLLELYREAAHKEFAGRSEETDAVLDLWKQVHVALRGDISNLLGLVDWVTKKQLFDAFCQAEGITLDHPWMESQDLEFHHLDPERNLALAFAQPGYWTFSSDEIESALTQPPQDTRACCRSRLMREADRSGSPYVIDWDQVHWNGKTACLLDPYALKPMMVPHGKYGFPLEE